ncbi:FMN-dependent oxidoreductase, nitrilotriacetate monooxygenase family [Arthrobacter alpinus]|uniref:FMN-dependent oxidoreductase, nitrilotriacetate monooxygenase family n=1 Tax=Arthrobacter alpinus TaxID=656366 RepID=A0A1H5NHV9_9MICC|nr:LLM class flavin-dependent oxidoreductase [Arthrobacter alpinus]SEF00407.1 FMN-dependent oxidoreductase, nitrilotriacetate monooxygenase family [Arthrobacter alpinus]
MATQKRELHLNAFVHGTGHHEASWRHPDVNPLAEQDIEHYLTIAKTAERGKLDSLFLADGLAISSNIQYNAYSSFEPLTLLSALATATERIGLIATASTTYNQPYSLARAFASVDRISGGRAGWNIVTSAGQGEAKNFNLADRPAHSLRYERAHEFLDTAKALWDSWADDAVVADQATGIYSDPDKIHEINHQGKHFQVRGPLNLPRPVQGHPLLVQAGSSEAGKEFAARHAEAVFTAHLSVESAREFYADLKGRLGAFGRSRDELLILPGISAYIGETEQEAQEKYDYLNSLANPDYGVHQLSQQLDFDLSGYSLDAQLPELPAETDGAQSRKKLIVDVARKESLTIRELTEKLAGARGHFTFIGTPAQVADEIELWFTTGAADGFNIMPPTFPAGLDDFVDKVVPLLQDRGLFRTEYTGRTLREHYGLARPEATLAGRGSQALSA